MPDCLVRVQYASSLRRFVHHLFRRETVLRALKVAGIVGPILTLINQYDVLLSLDFSPRLLAKIGLTFLVPYSVSSFSSARAYMDNKTAADSSTGTTTQDRSKGVNVSSDREEGDTFTPQ